LKDKTKEAMLMVKNILVSGCSTTIKRQLRRTTFICNNSIEQGETR